MLKKWISKALIVMLHPIKLFPELSDAHNVRYKIVFLQNVFTFAGFVSLIMGVLRWEQQPIIGKIDVTFGLLAFLLLSTMQRYRHKIELIASIALWLCFIQFMAVFFLADGNNSRSGLLLLILAGAFYLKGRLTGYYMLAMIVMLVVSNHFLAVFDTHFTNLDILTLCFYLLAQFFIIHNYESLRETQTQHLKTLNQDLEALVKKRTEQLAAANHALELEKQNLKKLSDTDHLTGLSNRHHFEALFSQQQRISERDTTDALILIDIDYFKHINDTHGHIHGDNVLKGIARSMREHTRASDISVRWGGDELIIYAPRTTLLQARQLAEKLRDHIQTLQLPDVGTITISAGVAVLCPGDTFSQLLQRADQALYRAKQAGRNCIQTFEPA
ncbi:GGDEF domain-containing protein [Methylophilus aquaticus]|uniref:diguanylate cyclase n=1 Tax=Methylophilus aquaticus TaxID=1971610 RepID=A0ABT9JTZ0_9PROT|nr:GGDEF domain-containing protein [Methylophilus aquaticus]MDP8567611.1 GGDEF domain-containing protein [Methylophilus aquaticus]